MNSIQFDRDPNGACELIDAIMKRHTDIEEEFNRIKNKDVERQGQEAVSLFGALGASGGALMRPLVISLALMFFQQFSGINAVIFYSASIFQAAGSSVDRFISSITIAIVQLVCTLLAALSVDRFGRRCLLLISGAFMATSLTGLAAYLHLTTTSAAADGDATGEDQLQLTTQLGWIPLLCLMSFIVACNYDYLFISLLI
jgi:facilitated trehalose transporter